MEQQNNYDFIGLWIPNPIFLDYHLSDKEKLILCLILYKSKFKGYCSLGNKYLSNIFHISETQCSKLISSLNKKNYIDVKLMYELNSKEVKARIIKPKQFVMNYMKLGIKEKFNTSLTKLQPTIEENFKDNKKYYKNNKDDKPSFYYNYDEDFFETLYEN